MKFTKFAAAAVALSTLTCSALAADLPSRKAAVYAPPPPVFTWSGFYVGLNAGGSFGGSRNNSIYASPVAALPTFQSEAATSALLAMLAGGNNGNGGNSRFIGGGQIGFNYQFSNALLLGLEADFQGLAGGSSGNGTNVAASPVLGFAETIVQASNAGSNRLTHLGTLRARLGYLVTPTFLLYGTGGLAYGGGDGRGTTIVQVDTGAVAGFGAPYGARLGGGNSSRVGWTAGGGVEWMFLPNWSLKLEYLYYRMDNRGNGLTALANLSAGFAPAGTVIWGSALKQNQRVDGHIARLGVNYHFNWFGASAPVVARY